MGVVLESTLLEAVTALVGVCTLVYCFFISKYNYWKKKGVPFLKPEFPFGNFKEFILLRVAQIQSFKDIYDKCEGMPYVGVYQLWKPILLVRDPEMLKHVLVKDFAYFHDRGINVGDPKQEPLAEHLFGIEGAKWRNLRNRLTPTFTSGKMKFMFNVMLECAQELENFLKDSADKGETLEVKDMTAKFTTDVIGTCAFGLQLNSMKDPDSEFRAVGRKIFVPSLWTAVKRTVRNFMPSVYNLLRLRTLDKNIERFFISAIKDTMKYREDNGITRNDFLQLLIQLKNKGKIQDDALDHNGSEVMDNQLDLRGEHLEFTDGLLTAQAFIFFIAGFETSSTTISFCLHELAVNPEVQDKLRKEIDAALKQHGSLSYESIQALDYLGKVVDGFGA